MFRWLFYYEVFCFPYKIYEINLDNLINSSNISLSSAFADTALIGAFHILFSRRCCVYFHALCVINLTFQIPTNGQKIGPLRLIAQQHLHVIILTSDLFFSDIKLRLSKKKNILNSQPLNEKVDINMNAEFGNTYTVPGEKSTWLSTSLQQIQIFYSVETKCYVNVTGRLCWSPTLSLLPLLQIASDLLLESWITNYRLSLDIYTATALHN